MPAVTLTCLVCDRSVAESEREAAYRPATFDDVCICPACLAGERDGYAANAASVRAQLRRDRREPQR